MTILVKLTDVIKKYDQKVILDGISFEVSEGESMAIVGFSGSGKSTVLKIISGIEPYQGGNIEVNDPKLSMVFQYSALFDSLSIFDNIAFALTEGPERKKHFSKDELKTIVHEKLKMVGLKEDVENVLPGALSGGMQKRVSFARAIVNDPKIILYDEPTSGLDPVASTVIEDYINRLKGELGAASLVVTHQISTITRTADKVIMLYDGKIVWRGTPQEMLETDDPYAKQFVNADRNGPMKTVAG